MKFKKQKPLVHLVRFLSCRVQIGKSAIHRNHDVVEELDLGNKIGLFRQVYSVHFVKSFDKLDENHDVDLVIYTCIESKPSRSKSSHTVNPILLDKKYLSANTQC